MSDIDDPNDSLKRMPPGPWQLKKSPVSGATLLHFTGAATFDDCFEVVFDPAVSPALWLERRRVAGLTVYRCNLMVKTFLRAVLRGLLGPGRGIIGVGDVEGCAREQFDHLVATGVFESRGGRVECNCHRSDLDHDVGIWTTTGYYKNSAWAVHTGPQATLGAAMRHASAPYLSVTKPGGPIDTLTAAAAKIAEQVDQEIVEAITRNSLASPPRIYEGPIDQLRGRWPRAPVLQGKDQIGVLSAVEAETPVYRALCYLCARRPVVNAGAVCSTCRDTHLAPPQEA